MGRNKNQTPSTQVPRTAADVIADGWKDGDDFEISFTVTAPTGQQSGTGKGGKRK